MVRLQIMSKPKTIFRVKKTNNFFVLSRFVAQDERLSLEARGLLIFLLSMPDDWIVCIGHLVKISPAKRDKIRRILKELIEFNYIQKEERRNEEGRFSNPEYIVYEFPCDGYFDHLLDYRSGKTAAVNPSPVEPQGNNPPLQRKQLKQNIQVTNNTTTKDLVWSPKLNSEHQESILSLLSVIDQKSAQLLLDELSGQLDNIKNPVGYLRTLLKAYQAGNFTAAKALQTQATRAEKQANEQAVQKSLKAAEDQLLLQINQFTGNPNE